MWQRKREIPEGSVVAYGFDDQTDLETITVVTQYGKVSVRWIAGVTFTPERLMEFLLMLSHADQITNWPESPAHGADSAHGL